MVNLTRIYTRTGDDGTTGLGDFGRTRKTDPRLAAYADVNEANAALGVALAAGGLSMLFWIAGQTQWNVILAAVICAAIAAGVETWRKRPC